MWQLELVDDVLCGVDLPGDGELDVAADLALALADDAVDLALLVALLAVDLAAAAAVRRRVVAVEAPLAEAVGVVHPPVAVAVKASRPGKSMQSDEESQIAGSVITADAHVHVIEALCICIPTYQVLVSVN